MAAPPDSVSMCLNIAQRLFNTLKCCIDSDSETRKALLRQRGVAKDMRAWLEEHLGRSAREKRRQLDGSATTSEKICERKHG